MRPRRHGHGGARPRFNSGAARFARGIHATSHYFVMDWASVWIDIVLGLLIAGALAAWVPPQFWQAFFLVHHPLLARIWDH